MIAASAVQTAVALVSMIAAGPLWQSSAAPVDERSATEERLAVDDFESGLDRWSLESPEQIEIRDEPGTENRLLQLTPERGGFVQALLAESTEWRNVRFEGRFQFPTDGDGYLGFLYNHQRHGERADFGCLYVKSNGSYVRVSPHYDGNPSWRLYEELRVDLEGERRIRVGRWYPFRLDVTGSLAELYIEDLRSPVVRFDLFEQDRGALGLEARPGGGEPVWVDDVRVTRLPPAGPGPPADAGAGPPDRPGVRAMAVATAVVWEVQGPVTLDQPVALDPPELSDRGWRQLEPDRRGMLVTGLVTRYRSAENDGAYLRARFVVGGDGADAPTWLAVSSANRLDVWLNGYYRGTVAPERFVWADYLTTRRGARIPIAPSPGANELVLRVHGDRFAGGGLYLSLLANAEAPSAPPRGTGAERTAAVGYPPLPRGAEPLIEPGSFVLVGEVHGTVEAPAFVAALACTAARRAGRRGLVLGVEMPRSDQPALDAFFALESAAAARRELLSAGNFTDVWLDGRDSRAIVSLLEDLRRWRRAGLSITPVAFDVAPGGATGADREAAMAERIAAAAEGHPGATVLVYTGNLHSRTAKGVPWDPELLPMGARLRQRFPRLRAVDFASAGGSTWACITVAEGAAPECGEHRQKGRDRGDRPFVELWDEPDEKGYDGLYYLGPISASPPAGQAPPDGGR